MMPLKDWLKRGAKRPKQKKRIRPMSKKREREQVIYLKKRKAFLREHPYCQVWLMKEELYGEGALSEEYAIENGGQFKINSMPSSCPRSTDVHHSRGRIGKSFLDESTWVACSRQEHTWLHSHPKEARKLGLLAP